MDYASPRGTQDFLPRDTLKREITVNLLRSIALDFGFREIETPMFERLEVFARSSGESSDVVRKEMYVFEDRGKRAMALRPEGTAGVIRAYVQHKLYATEETPYKLFYVQPAFRYERPQAGRYRQHTQFGMETIGAAYLENDVEIILQVFHMLNSLGLTDFYFKINCLGDKEARQRYEDDLKAYFAPHIGELCDDCKERLAINPLRVLDCKVDCEKEFFKKAPKILDYIGEESRRKFAAIRDYLEEYQVPYEVDPGLVRGLDYYNETVFEVYLRDKGVAIGAGGRYDNLVRQLGGPDMPCVGFALGLERLIEALDANGAFAEVESPLLAYVMPLNKKTLTYAFHVATHLRFNEIPTEIDYACRSLKAQFKSVAKRNAKFAVLIGEDEEKDSSVTVKNTATKEQKKVRVEEVSDYILEEYMKEQEKGECCARGENCKNCRKTADNEK